MKRLLAAVFVSVISFGFTLPAFAASDISHAAALSKLGSGFRTASSGSCSDPDKKSCTSLQGIRSETLQGLADLKAATGDAAKWTITGGTECGHSGNKDCASGASDKGQSHYNGYKIDLGFNANPGIQKKIEDFLAAQSEYYECKKPNGSQFAAKYAVKLSSGQLVEILHETQPPHWDFTFLGGSQPSSTCVKKSGKPSAEPAPAPAPGEPAPVAPQPSSAGVCPTGYIKDGSGACRPTLIASGLLAGRQGAVLADSQADPMSWALQTLLPNIARVLISLASAIAVICLIWAGYIYLTAGGDDDRIGSAKKIIIYTFVGLAVALLSFIIVRIVTNIDFGGERQQGTVAAVDPAAAEAAVCRPAKVDEAIQSTARNGSADIVLAGEKLASQYSEDQLQACLQQ